MEIVAYGRCVSQKGPSKPFSGHIQNQLQQVYFTSRELIVSYRKMSKRRGVLAVVAFFSMHMHVLLPVVCAFSPTPPPPHLSSKVAAAFPNMHSCCGRQQRIRATAAGLYSTSSSSPSLEYLETVKTGITEFGNDIDDWHACGQLLSQRSGLSESQSLDLLARAWNWKAWAVTTSKIARKYIKPIPPNVQTLQAAIDWLQGAPLYLTTPQQLATAILADPVAYLVDPCSLYQKARQAAPVKYQDADVFLALVLAKPAALKNYYNCNGSGCNSECGNCWVSFQMAGEI
jgi:hypothetical protein